MKVVGQPIPKKDSMALVTGKPVYTEDIAPKDCLVVKLLRSPHAHALIESINTTAAKKVPGIECVLTWEDVKGRRFTHAGQTYPEASPYDRLILDQRVRFVGDPVAIVAGVDEKTVNKALKLIKVKYQVLEPLLDFHVAKDNPILVHPEDNWESLAPVGADNKRNLSASGSDIHGDVDAVMAECDVVIERSYRTKANQQAMMETFRTFTYLDYFGRLNIVSSTQVPFHVRRIVSTALGIKKSQIRVIKPRIGGGFGAKQTLASETFPSVVTMKTGKPAMIIFDREESLTASSPRHQMQINVKLGAMRDGTIRAVDMYTVSDSGAYGDHSPTTIGLTGAKAISLYGKIEAHRFVYDVVYTNTQASGAYRGYGATQGLYAMETCVNELADKLGIDPVKIREMNFVQQGQVMPAYYYETNTSCSLDRCLARVKDMIHWDEKCEPRVMPDGKIRTVGIAGAMQSSGISGMDVGSASIELNDDGFYVLSLGATDMGTGCDTILAQMAAEVLECDVDNIITHGVDTDSSPYDSGSYASSTTYVTGVAVVKAANQLIEKIVDKAAMILKCSKDVLQFSGNEVKNLEDGRVCTLEEIGNAAMFGANEPLRAIASNSSPVSPPPFMVGAVEIEFDPETAKFELIDYKAAVDCGTPINPNLARVQAEGGIVQGIGMAMYEDVPLNSRGAVLSNSLMQYKIPTRQDICPIEVVFEPSYEASGPFGAKSIGELVINTPSPAITQAVYKASGVWIRELPVTPEKVMKAMMEQGKV
ncbi:MAG: xanthine dehydrogenase family protein molybdopterin-binding subunit [Lachnospiraceae bacterium]